MFLFISKILVPKGFSGITIYPFVFVRDNYWAKKQEFITHEKIHLKQQIELLILFFYLWYGIEFIIRIGQYKNVRKAYRNISFEREAYANEKNINYTVTRKFFSFIKYL